MQEVRRLIAALLDDAKSHGRVRADITSTDLTIILWSIRGVIETTRGASVTVRFRATLLVQVGHGR